MSEYAVGKYAEQMNILQSFEAYLSKKGHPYHKSSGKKFVSIETETSEGKLLVVELEICGSVNITSALRYYMSDNVVGVYTLQELTRLV